MNILVQSVTNHAVNQRHRARPLRICLVLITSVSWFSIVNHCALASLNTLVGEGVAQCHADCCGNQPPVRHQNKSETECCKTLHATLSVPAKRVVGYNTSLFAAQIYFVAPVTFLNEPKVTLCGGELDTGPPFAKSFAESVLQRSILAHAPPSLA